MIYNGVNANSTGTYLYQYYPYTVSSGTSYTISILLKSSQAWSGNITSYMLNSGGTYVTNNVTQAVSLTSSGWTTVTWTMPATLSSSSVGFGLKFASFPSGATLYAARPQLEALPYATSYTDSTRSPETLTFPTNVFSSLPAQGTIEAWVKFNGTHSNLNGNSFQTILDVAGTGDHGLIMGLDSNNHVNIQAGIGNGSTISAHSSTTINPNTWYHVAGTWSQTGLSVFVNGTILIYPIGNRQG